MGKIDTTTILLIAGGAAAVYFLTRPKPGSNTLTCTNGRLLDANGGDHGPCSTGSGVWQGGTPGPGYPYQVPVPSGGGSGISPSQYVTLGTALANAASNIFG